MISQYIKVTKYLTDKPSDLKTIGMSLPVGAGDSECIQMDSDVYSTLTFQSPSNFHEWFSYDHEIHSHSTRSGAEIIREEYFDVGVVAQTYTLHTKGSQNKYGENMIQKSGPIIWNSIPEPIQDATSISSFKNQLKKHLLAQYDLDNTGENIIIIIILNHVLT